MKRLLLTAAVISFLPFGATAQEMVGYSELPSGNYSLDKTHASLIWEVSHFGLSDYTARFTDFDIDIDYNAEDPASSVVTATVNPLSIKTDYPNADEKDFDKKLSEGEEWLNAGEYPEITFKSTSITIDEDNAAQNPPVINALPAMALRKIGLKTRHLLVRQPIQITHPSGSSTRA